MVSNTKQTRRRRILRKKRMGTERKRLLRKGATPAFPIHPEGYDPNAADAKPVAKEG